MLDVFVWCLTVGEFLYNVLLSVIIVSYVIVCYLISYLTIFYFVYYVLTIFHLLFNTFFEIVITLKTKLDELELRIYFMSW